MSNEVTKYLQARDQNAQLRKHVQYLLSILRSDVREPAVRDKLTEIQNYITHNKPV